MKRNEIVEKLMKEGFSEKTLFKLSDKQICWIAEKLLGEKSTTNSRAENHDEEDESPIDLTDASDEEIQKFIDLMGLEDGFIIKKDGNYTELGPNNED